MKNLSAVLEEKLICPITKSKLQKKNNQLESVDSSNQYPIVEGIPVLINEERSVFKVEDFTEQRSTTFDKQSTVKRIISAITPSITADVRSRKNYDEIGSILKDGSRILIVGGSIQGSGMQSIYANETFDIVGSDVSHGPSTNLISDAHDIPFEDGVFDCVIYQAVLEHTLDPHRCVEEAHRVLNSTGILYAETPFMQQVHMKQYDFTRFTHLGHRRLFRFFEEISSGPTSGPGSALAWSYTHLLRSLSSRRAVSQVLSMFGRCTSFFLKYIDYLIIEKPGTYDAASGLFFLGRKSETPLSDHDLLKQYRGFK